MVFSKNTYPVLDFIRSKQGIYNMICYETKMDKFNEVSQIIMDCWNKYYQNYNNVKYITKPLEDAIFTSGDKLVNYEMIKNIDTQSGILLFNNGYQIVYNIVNKNIDSEDTNNIEITVMYLIENKLTFFYHTPNLSKDKYATFVGHKDYETEPELNFICHKEMLPWVIATLNFLKYAKVETKYLKSGSKIKENNVKSINTSNSNIQIIDSNWFTTLIKSDAFKVRGHFRLQPCGEGLKDKKLIYIEDFEKNGYVRKAKKLSVYGEGEIIS